ncbi:hypothetical protein N8967_01145 [Akkermansiaceae bacterium]|nr:hypothetical protein [Akkermansiaceae bacterium]
MSCPCAGEEVDSAKQAYSAEALRKTLDPFYKQHIVADGLVVAGSEKVSLPALREVGYLAKKLLANRPDVMSALCEKRKMFVAVMAYCELQTDLPDCRGMSLWWAYRARGLGSRPVSCGEENVLNFKGDPWAGENIFIHEFAHGIQSVIGGLDDQFDQRLRDLFDKSEKSGRFRGYAIEGGDRRVLGRGCAGVVQLQRDHQAKVRRWSEFIRGSRTEGRTRLPPANAPADANTHA